MPVPYQYGYNTPRYPTSRGVAVAREQRPQSTGVPWAPQAGGTPRNFYRGGVYDERLGSLGGGRPRSGYGDSTPPEKSDTLGPTSRLNGPEFYGSGPGRGPASGGLGLLAGAAVVGALGAGAAIHHEGKVGALASGSKALKAGQPGLPSGPRAAPPAGHNIGPEGSGHFNAPYSPLDSKYNLKKYAGRSNPSHVAKPLELSPGAVEAIEVRSWVEGQSRAQRRSNNSGATRSVWNALYED